MNDYEYAEIEEYAELLEAYEAGHTTAESLYEWFNGLYEMSACKLVILANSR